MSRDVEITPRTAEQLDRAAVILAERQPGLRAPQPELPVGVTEASGCRPLLAELLDRDGSHGVACGPRD